MKSLDRNFDYEQLTYDDRVEIHDALAETTLKHIVQSDGLFYAEPYDPARNPSQELEVVHLSAKEAPKEEIDFLASAANKELYEVAKTEFSRQTAFFGLMKYLMEKRRQNLYVVTAPHAKIEDIAIEAAAWQSQMGEADQNGLVISRGVTTIGAFGMAASEVVQKIGHVFLTFPRTKTIEALIESYKIRHIETGLDPIDIEKLVRTNNKRALHEIDDWFAHKFGGKKHGKSLHVAMEGKTTKITHDDEGNPQKIILGKTGHGTVEMLRHGLVIPMVVWDGKQPFIKIGDPLSVKGPEDALKIQQWQAETLISTLNLSPENVLLEAEA